MKTNDHKSGQPVLVCACREMQALKIVSFHFSVCTCCVYFSSSAFSYATRMGRLPSHQSHFSPQPFLPAAENVRRCDSSWGEASSLFYYLSVCTSHLFMCLALLPWRADLKVTVAPLPPGQNKAWWEKTHFSPSFSSHMGTTSCVGSTVGLSAYCLERWLGVYRKGLFVW